MSDMIELPIVIQTMSALIAVHAMITSLQMLSIHDQFASDGLLDWNVLKLTIRSNSLAPVIEPILQPPRFRWVLAAQLVAGVFLLLSALIGNISPVVLVVLFLTYLGIILRLRAGLTGDLHLAIVVTVGLILATAFPSGSVAQSAAVVFVAAQVILSYFVAGVGKFSNEDWRNGSAVEGIFATRAWGDKRVYDLFRTFPRLKVAASWSVIGFECLFVLSIVVDVQVALVFLLGGLLFHISNAVFMGLNSFVIAFASAYPAVLYTNQLVEQFFL